MESQGVVVAINVSAGGLPKRAVVEAMITEHGIMGDQQRDLRRHGGPDRALCIYSAELIEALHTEGHAIVPGAAGENVTVRGILWERVTVGTRLQLGSIDVEITEYAAPCTNLRALFINVPITRISQKTNPGWSRVYARVLRTGLLRTGDSVILASGLVGA